MTKVIFIMTESIGNNSSEQQSRRDVLKGIGAAALSVFMPGCKTDKDNNSVLEPTLEARVAAADIFADKQLALVDERKDAKESVSKYMLGDTEVRAVVYEKGDGLTYFNMHDDENTAVQAVRGFIDSNGGRLIELQHTGQRNITFKVEGKEYQIDPNRMFTDAGVKLKLQPYDIKAANVVRNFANRLVEDFHLGSPAKGTMVAVHNNTDNMYSGSSYLPGGSEAKDAADVYIKPNSDADDFFFVTDRKTFETFRQSGFNVVLQDNSNVRDDGSLSVYCGQNGVIYVNIEAQHGHNEIQSKMLEAVHKMVVR